MPEKEQFEFLIVGSGEAGKNLAWAMAKEGRRTAVVELRLIGGSCPNIACLPSKNVIYSAKVAELARHGAEFGLKTNGLRAEMAYRLTTIPVAKIRRAVSLMETRGFLKALIDTENDEILGFTAFAADSGEMMAVVQATMLAKQPYGLLRDAILAHPTMAEGLNVLFDSVPARSTARTTKSDEGRQKVKVA